MELLVSMRIKWYLWLVLISMRIQWRTEVVAECRDFVLIFAQYITFVLEDSKYNIRFRSFRKMLGIVDSRIYSSFLMATFEWFITA